MNSLKTFASVALRTVKPVCNATNNVALAARTLPVAQQKGMLVGCTNTAHFGVVFLGPTPKLYFGLSSFLAKKNQFISTFFLHELKL